MRLWGLRSAVDRLRKDFAALERTRLEQKHKKEAGASTDRGLDASVTSVMSGISDTTVSDIDPMHAQSLPMEARRANSNSLTARPESIEMMQTDGMDSLESYTTGRL